MLDREKILQALSKVKDPELQRSLTDLKMVRQIDLADSTVSITIALTVPTCPRKADIEADVRAAVSALPGVEKVKVRMIAMTQEERKEVFGEPEEGAAVKYNQVKNVVAVMSGKGGVGKSLVTALLAVALTRSGQKVGILDADITGPSIPKLFGLHGPVNAGPVGMIPVISQSDIKVMSFNLLLQMDDQPVVWRGPLIGRAITQLWGDVIWGSLDTLLIDLPPGTSDAALTTLQSLPVNGIVMVTTPQSLASMIVSKAVNMANSIGVPIYGIVENMAYFTCPETGKRHEIFGESHADEVVKIANAPLLAKLPIDPRLTARCDQGQVEQVELAEMEILLEGFRGAVSACKPVPA